MRNFKRLLSVLLTVMLTVEVFSFSAQAIIYYHGEGNGDYTFYIGKYDSTDNYAPSSFDDRIVITQDLPLGLGIASDNWGIVDKCFKGTASPGSVGSYTVKLMDPEDNEVTTYTITIARGPQTITPISDYTKKMGDANFTVTPESENGNGDVISAGSTDAPTYTFTGSNDSVATIGNTTGEVVIVGPGTTTITVSSAATDSYEAATPITFDITVNKADPTVSLSGAAPSGTAGAVGAKTITVTVADSYNETINLTCEINGIQKTGARSGNGDVSFNFTAAELNALAVNSYPIMVSSEATTNNNAVAATQVGTLTVNAAAAPGAPTNVTASAGSGRATVSFTAPASNGGSAIASYTVTCVEDSTKTATGTASPITVTGLTNGTAYTFTVTATNGVGTGQASAASNSVTPASGSTGGGSSSTTTQKTAEIGGVDVNYTIDSGGVVTLKPTTAQLEKLLAAIGSDGVLNIAMSGIDGMKGAIIEIDLTKLTASGKLQIFSFSALDMELRFPAGTLESMKKLATTLRFGLRPGSLIFELTDANGKDVNWYDYANPVTISMAYTLPQDVSTQQIVMVRKDGSIIPRSWYSGDKVYAKIHEPGTYDAAVKPLGSFTDTAGLWMDEAVGYMAARGIVEGVGSNQFDRGGTITRAHFVTMLMRALDVESAADNDALPTDYADAPEWAQAYIATAAAMGITLTDEDGYFNPDAAITRQEMFYMAYEVMGACGMLPETFTEQWIIFSDWDGSVKTEYSDAIQNLAKLGLVNGNGDGTLNPNGTSTRAEGAQFLYNILKYDVK